VNSPLAYLFAKEMSFIKKILMTRLFLKKYTTIMMVNFFLKYTCLDKSHCASLTLVMVVFVVTVVVVKKVKRCFEAWNDEKRWSWSFCRRL
jgi:hypothetical protein